MKKLLLIPLTALLIFGTHTYSVKASNSRVLEAIRACLPQSNYQFSLADYADIKPSRWLLVRAVDNPVLAPSYSIVEIKNQNCKNHSFNRTVVDLRGLRTVPRRVLDRFATKMSNDANIAWKQFQDKIQKQYPGKSESQLKKMGVYGLD
jgi:hypothetical protein